MSDLHFMGLGGTDEVGASSYLYVLKEGNLLIDAGVRPGRLGDAALPDFTPLADLKPSAMILTHAHLDHLGALPVVTSRFPKMLVYCTQATARIANLVLGDTLKISTQQGVPLFSAGQMMQALERLRIIPYFETITDHGYSFMLIPSGHLIGAASVLISSGGREVFHTGDVSNIATPVVNAAHMPAEPISVSAVVSESTYGDTLLPSRKEQVKTFVTAIGQTLRGGGRVLIPSFALGRAQEITQVLLGAMTSGLIPKVPLYLDGLTRGITELYEDMLDELPDGLNNFKRSSGQPAFLREPLHLVKDRCERERIIHSDRPAVVIASSGMLHAGASPQYARAWLPSADNALFVVGYQDAESPGRRLLELQQGGEVMLPNDKGNLEPVSAYSRVERFYLSAHADRGGLIGLISRYPAGRMILTHGEVSARNNLAGYLNTKMDVSLPKAGDLVALKDGGHRRGAFIQASTKKLAATKERHARAKVEISYDAEHHVLVVELPDKLSGELFQSGEYSLEVLKGKLTKIKLVQRDTDTDQAGVEIDPPIEAELS
ncbi:MBL fold metallo-hydrolase [Deinococcus psychrotolerans]|uniref:MBL fold metallo-hydrolase n=1 Tax=Deinococcus psychrotolerans TaxID=2489213 RepID=A0A3G8YHH8_9DEIO|nr:MBL fold metallo-hydrolase [Deinococcus psychrotolerans]